MDIGAPNVREAQHHDEVAALEKRYRDAQAAAAERKADERLHSFETAIQTRSRAVVNLWPSLLAELLDSGRGLYSNYTLQVSAEVRKPASAKNDRMRRAVDGLLFGSYAPEIRYAALSLDGSGLSSYGPCAVTISDTTTAARATLLEENSYTFTRRHQIMPGVDLPQGYRAVWADRHKLAVAKLASAIEPNTLDESFPSLLLHGDGNRENDDFVEVYIYGPFDHQAIDGVVSPVIAKAPRQDRADLERIRDRVVAAGKKWVER